MKPTIVLLVLAAALVACYGRPTLNKSRTTSRHRNWEDFFIIDPTLDEEDFHIKEILDRNGVTSSNQGWSDCGKFKRSV